MNIKIQYCCHRAWEQWPYFGPGVTFLFLTPSKVECFWSRPKAGILVTHFAIFFPTFRIVKKFLSSTDHSKRRSSQNCHPILILYPLVKVSNFWSPIEWWVLKAYPILSKATNFLKIYLFLVSFIWQQYTKTKGIALFIRVFKAIVACILMYHIVSCYNIYKIHIKTKTT